MEIFFEIKTLVLEWLGFVWEKLPMVFLALVVVVVFWMLGGVVKKVFLAGLKRTSIRLQLRRLIAMVAGVVVLLLGLFVALSILGLDQAVTSLLAGAGIIGIAIGFAFQDMLSNFIAGVMLASESPFNTGDFIETNGFSGYVKSVDLRYTKIVTLDGKAVYLPNKEIFQNPLVNYHSESARRVELRVGVAYGSDLKKVEKVALDAVKGLHEVENKSIDVQFVSFGGSSIDLVVKFWVKTKDGLSPLEGQSEAIKLIKKAFEKNDIAMPFPMRTLEIQGLERLIK